MKRKVILVDLDKTLAYYKTWPKHGGVGGPIPTMVHRVKGWLLAGHDVRIFTARVSGLGRVSTESGLMATEGFIQDQREKITVWCVEHLGVALPVTCEKSFDVDEIWDDRAMPVIPNTGQPAPQMFSINFDHFGLEQQEQLDAILAANVDMSTRNQELTSRIITLETELLEKSTELKWAQAKRTLFTNQMSIQGHLSNLERTIATLEEKKQDAQRIYGELKEIQENVNLLYSNGVIPEWMKTTLDEEE